MRTDVKVATLSLAVFLGACNTRQEPVAGLSEDLKKDLAVASSSASDLATAPQSYRRARFVSDVEMASRTKLPAPKLVATKRRTKPVRRAVPVNKPTANDVVEDPAVAANEELAPAAAAVPAATSTPEPVVIAEQPTEERAPEPAPTSTGRGEDGRSVGEGGIGDRSTGRGIGGMLGGIIGAVVIRGGIGGVDKCDPRTDGRRRGGIMVQRPDFGMPSPVGRTTFPSM